MPRKPPTQNALSNPHRPPEESALRTAEEAAQSVLLRNFREGRIKPSRELYPHIWNWDAGFAALGLLHFDPPKAYAVFRNLFAGQWSDGFLPHIIFHPDHLEHFPGPDYWQAKRSGRVPSGLHTSGISQPPVHASMLVRALELDTRPVRARGALEEFYPRLRALHDYFFDQRDPTGEGLVVVLHPWESGLDNASIWDQPLDAIDGDSPWARDMEERYSALALENERPPRPYIRKYSWLVEQLWSRDYDWAAIVRDHPLRVQGVLFNAVLRRSEKDLATIASAIGEDPKIHEQRADALAEAINRKLWDPSRKGYFNYDLWSGRHVIEDTTFSYMPLYSGICPDERGNMLISHLNERCYCIGGGEECAGIPSADRCSAGFEGSNYWRGPVWYNINWFIEKGLRLTGAETEAAWVRERMLRLAVDRGFYEYYEADTGVGLGAKDFSWSAALFLDLLHEHRAHSK